MKVLLNGIEYNITQVISDDYGLVVYLNQKYMFRLFEDFKAAGEAARQYWIDLMNDSPEEFIEAVTPEQACIWLYLALNDTLDLNPYFNSFKAYPIETWGFVELPIEWPQIPKHRRTDITDLNALYHYIGQIESGEVGDGDVDAVDELAKWLDEYGEGVLYTIAYSNERL